jgi:hypothetical protein
VASVLRLSLGGKKAGQKRFMAYYPTFDKISRIFKGEGAKKSSLTIVILSLSRAISEEWSSPRSWVGRSPPALMERGGDFFAGQLGAGFWPGPPPWDSSPSGFAPMGSAPKTSTWLSDILDEATTFVDNESELLAEKALATVLTGRASIIIAHRLSTIRRTNRILVLDRGRLAKEGSHEELLA